MIDLSKTYDLPTFLFYASLLFVTIVLHFENIQIFIQNKKSRFFILSNALL